MEMYTVITYVTVVEYQQIPFQAQSGTLMTLVRCIFIL